MATSGCESFKAAGTSLPCTLEKLNILSHLRFDVSRQKLASDLATEHTKAGMLGVALKRDRGVVTAIFHVCSGLLILHVSSTPRC